MYIIHLKRWTRNIPHARQYSKCLKMAREQIIFDFSRKTLCQCMMTINAKLNDNYKFICYRQLPHRNECSWNIKNDTHPLERESERWSTYHYDYLSKHSWNTRCSLLAHGLNACTHFLPTLNPTSNHLGLPCKHLNCINLLFTVLLLSVNYSVNSLCASNTFDAVAISLDMYLFLAAFLSLSLSLCINTVVYTNACAWVTQSAHTMSTKMASDFRMHAIDMAVRFFFCDF